MSDLVLAIDQGTTGTTVFAIDSNGRVRGRAYREIRQYFPKPGWVEHDADEIARSAVTLAKAALTGARAKPSDLCAIGITNQRETFLLWERRTGKPLYRAIVWQCRRSADICNALRDRESELSERTGLLIDPYFSGTKLKWLFDQKPRLRSRAERGEVCFGTIDTWLAFRLSKGASFVTDYTNASRTMMLNLAQMDWDDEMLAMLGAPREMLPTLVSSRGPMAETAPGVLGPKPVPIAAMIGDQQSALYGQGAIHPGDSKSTYGTGAFLLMNTGDERVRSKNRLLTTAALGPEGARAYALEGSVFVAGAAIQWLRDGLGLLQRASDSRAMAHKSRDAQVYMVPAFVGLGAPYWDPAARGAIVGITRGTTRNDIVRAALDSIAYQVREVFVDMEKDSGRTMRELRADGGASMNPYLMQFQADILGKPVRRPRMAETTALGAAMLAGLATGVWSSQDDLEIFHRGATTFEPKMKRDVREALVAGWRDAVGRVLQSGSRVAQ